jgi:hypothetical protein
MRIIQSCFALFGVVAGELNVDLQAAIEQRKSLLNALDKEIQFLQREETKREDMVDVAGRALKWTDQSFPNEAELISLLEWFQGPSEFLDPIKRSYAKAVEKGIVQCLEHDVLKDWVPDCERNQIEREIREKKKELEQLVKESPAGTESVRSTANSEVDHRELAEEDDDSESGFVKIYPEFVIMSIGEKLKTTRLEIEKLEQRLSILNRARITKLSRDLFDQRQGDREINKIRELVQEVLDRIRGSSSSAGGLTVSPASDLKVSEVMVAGRALAGLAQKMRDDPTGELVGLFEKFTKAVTELANRDARLWSTNHGADDAAPIADPVIETIEQVNDLQELLKKLQPESGDESGVENLRAVLADRDLRFKALMESIAAIQSNVASASDLLIAQVESFQALEHNIVRLSPQQATDLEAGKGQAQTHIGIMMQSHFEHLLTQLPADDSMVSAVDVSKDRFDGVTQFLSQDGRDRVSNLKAQVDAAIRVAEFLKPEVQVNTLQELKGVLERLGAKEVVAQALSNNEKLMTAMRTRMAQVMDPTVLEEVASQIEQFSQELEAANAVEGIETILKEVIQFEQDIASVVEWLTVVLSAEKRASLIQKSNFAALKTSVERVLDASHTKLGHAQQLTDYLGEHNPDATVEALLPVVEGAVAPLTAISTGNLHDGVLQMIAHKVDQIVAGFEPLITAAGKERGGDVGAIQAAVTELTGAVQQARNLQIALSGKRVYAVEQINQAKARIDAFLKEAQPVVQSTVHVKVFERLAALSTALDDWTNFEAREAWFRDLIAYALVGDEAIPIATLAGTVGAMLGTYTDQFKEETGGAILHEKIVEGVERVVKPITDDLARIDAWLRGNQEALTNAGLWDELNEKQVVAGRIVDAIVAAARTKKAELAPPDDDD